MYDMYVEYEVCFTLKLQYNSNACYVNTKY